MSRNQIEALLDRYLKDETSQEENELVKNWLEENGNPRSEWHYLNQTQKYAWLEDRFNDIQNSIHADMRKVGINGFLSGHALNQHLCDAMTGCKSVKCLPRPVPIPLVDLNRNNISIVTMQPFNSRTLNSFGMVVISLYFSAVFTCPNTILLAQALTICMADLVPFPREPRTVFPSMLTIPPSVRSATLFTHSKKQASNWFFL